MKRRAQSRAAARRRSLSRSSDAKEAAAQLAAIVASSSHAIISKTLDGTVITWNEAATRLFGYGKEEMIGQPIRRLIPDRLQHEEDAILARIAAGGPMENYETVRLRKDGRLLDVAVTISPIRDAAGKVIGASKIARDITMRKQAEEALRNSEERLRQAADLVGLCPYTWDPATGALEWDGRLKAMWGLPPDATVNHEVWLAGIHPEDRARVEERAADSLDPSGDGIYEAEYRVNGPDGVQRWVSARGCTQFANGKAVDHLGVAVDFTVRKEAEAALKRALEQFETLADGMPTLCWMAEPDGRRYWYNKRWYDYTGTAREDMEGSGWESVHDPEALPAVLAQWSASLASGAPFEMTFPLRGADGVFRPFLTRVAPDLGPDGRIRRWLGTNTDVTEERRMRAALEESKARLRLFIERAPAAIAMFDKDMRYLAASRRFLADYNLAGEGPESLLGRSHYGLFPDLTNRWRDIHRRVLTGETLSGDEDPFPRLDGRTDWIKWEMTPWRLADGTVGGAILFSEVANARREAEAALRESQKRHEALVQSAMDAIIAIDAYQRIVLFNRAAERMFRCPASEAIGCLVDRFIPEPLRQGHREHVRRFGETGTTSRQMGALGSLSALRANGEEFPIEASISQLHAGGQKLFTVILRDITERKRHEQHAQMLMHEVNHRAKNMLAVVQSIARQTAAAGPEDFLSRFSERIQALSMSQDLLVNNEWRGVDIAGLVLSQLSHYRDLIGTRIKLKGPPILISASAAQTIGMAVHELSTNAGKYGALSNGTGRLEVGWNLGCAEEDDDTFIMYWREESGPPVKPPAKYGFGSIVIQRIASESLDAKVSLDFAPAGLSWRLCCPAKEVSATRA